TRWLKSTSRSRPPSSARLCRPTRLHACSSRASGRQRSCPPSRCACPHTSATSTSTITTSETTMTSEAITDALTELGIRGLAADLDAFIARAKKERWSASELVEKLVEVERADRARRSLERRSTRSRVGAFKPLTDFDWSWFRSVDRDAIDRIMKLGFV